MTTVEELRIQIAVARTEQVLARIDGDAEDIIRTTRVLDGLLDEWTKQVHA